MSNPVQEALAAHNLHEFGRVLDGMDSGTVPLSARQYRKAALFAARLLRMHANSMAIREVCALSPGLQTLLENLEFEVTGAELGALFSGARREATTQGLRSARR